MQIIANWPLKNVIYVTVHTKRARFVQAKKIFLLLQLVRLSFQL